MHFKQFFDVIVWSSCYFFYTFVRLSFISVLQGKRYFSFLRSDSSVIRSEYETSPCSRVSSKNKENISLQSNLSLSLSLLFFLFKKCFRRLLKSGVTRIELKDSDFSCGKKSGSMFFNDAMGEIESHIDISHTKRLSTAVYSFLS